MTADEMLEKLGYKIVYESDGVICFRNNKQDDTFFGRTDEEYIRDVVFYKGKKQYFVIVNFGDCVLQKYIEVELHQAITRKMKELGWIE